MAEIEEVTILRVDTGDSVRTIGQLREEVKQYRQQMNDAEVGSAEFTSALGKMTAAQDEIKRAMNEGKIALDQNADGTAALGKSYNALTAELANLRQAWKATTDQTERANLATRITGINDELKQMDASIGNYQRNVGNYTNAFLDAFSKMGGGVSGIINPIKSATGALQLMSQTPAVAILGLLATALTKVTSALKSSEANTQALNKALAPLRALGDAATRTLQTLGGVVVKLVEGFGKLAAAITGTNEATKERISLAEQEARLAQQTRETTVKNAEAERDAAELRAKAADRANYTAKERLDFLKQAGELEKQISQRAYEDAKAQYEIIKQRNALTQSSAEDLQQEADAYAAMVRAETGYYEKIRSINAGIARAMKEDASSAAKSVKEMKAAYEVPDFDADLADDDSAEWLARQQRDEERARAEADRALAAATQKQAIADEAARVRLETEQALTDALKAEQEKQAADAKAAAEQMQKAWMGSVQAVGAVLGSLADIYEANSDGSERAEKRIKNIRIAAATISTLQGAVGAYMQSVASIPPPAGIITGVAQAATVTAAGLAQIAKMRATSTSGEGATGTPSFSSPSVAVSAPSLPAATPTALATLATDTQTLNAIGSQRVYILASDLEANDNARKVRINETTF